MQLLYIKDDVGYEEFVAAVYEAENEGTETKVLNVKVKAMAVEKVMAVKEKIDLKGLKQQIASLSMVMKSATIEMCKQQMQEREFPPQGRKKCLGIHHKKGYKDHPRRERFP